MIASIIIDDEPHCIDRLKDMLLGNFSDTIALSGTADTVENGIRLIEQKKPALVFLDVQIHEKTGFDLLRNLGKVDFKVIFTTAYDKFAVEAFRFSALDYLLKPIDKDDLANAIKKFSDQSVLQQQAGKIDILLANLNSQRLYSKKIFVPTSSGFEVLNTEEIIRCESDVNYTSIYCIDRKKIVVAKTLKEFEELLSAYGFFRIHNSHLINMHYIKSYHRGKGGSVLLSDGSELEVSTRRKDEFLRRITEM